MGVLKDAFFSREVTMEDARSDVRWILAFISLNILVIGLINAIFSWEAAKLPLIAAAVLLIPVFLPNYWLQLAAVAGFTLFLWYDFYVRRNPFSIVYSLVGVYHTQLLIRARAGMPKEVPPAKKEETAASS